MPQPGLIEQIANLIFPPRCQVCGELGDSPLCETCLSGVEFIAEPICGCCGAPLDPLASGPPRCADCRRRRSFTAARAAGLYSGALRDAIRRYKYMGRRRLAEPLGRMLADAVRRPDGGGLPVSDCTALIPVPLHPARRAWRGFDQARLLADELGGALGMRVWPDALERVRNTTPQVDMRGRKRLENVRGAFEARRTYRLPGHSFILVDDVFTTGATISECARMLRRAGVEAVYSLTVARTAPGWHPASLLRAQGTDELWGDEP
ncbi:MAG TPA: ComF family protein [Armatimonadota bacterium]|nr:ComF family protein [Armatimonadota bacterium]